MIIIETCPECGHDLTNLVIAVYPPIPEKRCFNCGWHWVGETEKIKRIPFCKDELILDDLVDEPKFDWSILNDKWSVLNNIEPKHLSFTCSDITNFIPNTNEITCADAIDNLIDAYKI